MTSPSPGEDARAPGEQAEFPFEPPRYVLRTVEDFASLPPEKWEACLHDFGLWLATRAMCEALYPGAMKPLAAGFVWIDDGKHNAEVTVHDATGAVVERETIELGGTAKEGE